MLPRVCIAMSAYSEQKGFNRMRTRIRRGVAGAALALSMAVGVSIAGVSAAQAAERHFILSGQDSEAELRAWVAEYEQTEGVDCTISDLQEIVIPPNEDPSGGWSVPGYTYCS